MLQSFVDRAPAGGESHPGFHVSEWHPKDRLHAGDHFEGDHMGAVGRMAASVPIVNYVDHGENVTYGKDDDWWRQRRGPWMRGNGWGRHSDQLFDPR
jgi:hypothetical protein